MQNNDVSPEKTIELVQTRCAPPREVIKECGQWADRCRPAPKLVGTK
jgi:hypothetical protein